MVDSARHGPNLFVAIVGDTAKARKGTSWNNVRRIAAVADPEFVDDRIKSGFGSGEALVAEFIDVVNPLDKRLLVQDPEFARLHRRRP